MATAAYSILTSVLFGFVVFFLKLYLKRHLLAYADSWKCEVLFYFRGFSWKCVDGKLGLWHQGGRFLTSRKRHNNASWKTIDSVLQKSKLIWKISAVNFFSHKLSALPNTSPVSVDFAQCFTIYYHTQLPRWFDGISISCRPALHPFWGLRASVTLEP